ncbi:hypothetical protein GCM10011487_22410 [Steroidobacter agaridevorans]|uniref:Novel STAND NTPase 5 domain-containing protein n=1 Tax=Steroidobacter agaridevorans TaxID=2695856 RepID=A0A829YBI2_9GAMM|nr:SIR2 family protein [Steroidobacter agaridevorans]GFE80241.1 hypothetical protein GCM10011487_22410 [Steroidobacter agaridevorans]
MNEIPLGLRAALEGGECVLFVGAGIGEHLITRDGSPAPRAAQLAKEMAQHFHIETQSEDLAKVARVAELRKSRTDLESFLSKRLAFVEPDKTFGWLTTNRWRAIFTTNYDNGIERAYELNPEPPQRPVSISTTAGNRHTDPRFEVPVFHLHGRLGGEDGGPIVITDEDYTRYAERRRMLFEELREHFAKSTFLYIGYSARDTNWQQLHAELRREFEPTPLPLSYRIDPFADELDVEIQRSQNLFTLAYRFSDFVSAAQVQLKSAQLDADRLERIKRDVPPDLQAAFDRNPASVARLLSSWTYVNDAPFHEAGNTRSFLQGDRPNWALLAGGNYFKRDLEDRVFDSMLDYVTSTNSRPTGATVLASAGYGTTTLLMALATRFVREKAGPVFFHRAGTPLLEGDVEFATTLFDRSVPVFVIDDASDYTKQIDSAVSVLRNLTRPSYFLIGARHNEWAQARARRFGKSFDLEPLSDTEIDALLAFLSAHQALNKLEPLPKDAQIAAIKQRHGKELLVVLRETTEDRGFDAIVEDEFWGIQNDQSRQMYLSVCCLYQHGAMIRDYVLSQSLGLTIEALYSEATSGTEGVVMFESIDDATGTYAARARHRVIAAIVWERCGDPAMRTRITQASLAALNLNFPGDVRAFEQMVRSDRLVEGLQTLEDKIKFFETAIRKDPDSPYVRQHFARMFHRAGRYELALDQVEQGIALRPRAVPRVLYHTKGIILTSLALAAEGLEVGRRRLAQAEATFKQAISIRGSDEYAHQGLADLYLQWAKHVQSPEESSSYLSKCEDAVSTGLRNVKNKEGLWIVSANVEEFVGNEPNRLKALERAVQDSPQSIIARYLYARALRRGGKPSAACAILKDLVHNYPDEFRSATEYAVALYESGESIELAIATLRLSTLYGYSDPRFLATLGGLLFLADKFGEANDVFEEGNRRELPSDELQAIRFRPLVPGSNVPYRRTGRISEIRPGYCFINVPGLPRIFLHASKYRWLALKAGFEITFDLVFSAKGPLADKPELIPKVA